MVKHLWLREAWRYEIAAMLSQVGCVAMNTETVEAVYAGTALLTAKQERFKTHPSIAFDLPKRIPRLEQVAAMIEGQQGRPLGQAAQEPAAGVEPGEMGARLLKIAVDYDQMLLHGRAAREALSELKRRTDDYYPAAVAALETLPAESVALVTQEISIRDLATGMILDEDLRSSNGMLMVARNQKISYALLVRIRNFYEKTPLANKIRVKVLQHPTAGRAGRERSGGASEPLGPHSSWTIIRLVK
jgi:hypothetical protein